MCLCVAEEYESDLLCQWTLDCSSYPGTTVALAFTQLDTEASYDTVTVFDRDSSGNILGELSGALADQSVTSFTSSSPSLFIEFISDESIGAGGFEIQYTCGQPDRCLFPVTVDCGLRGECNNGACTCLDGYTGDSCENVPDQCEYPTHLDCGRHGTCSAGSCICEPGFTGALCEVRPDACVFPETVECGDHGICETLTWGSALCVCDDGWVGNRCQSRPPAQMVTTDGLRVVSSIASAGDQKWFSFNATHGATYQIATELIGLADTVMGLYEPDRVTVIAENDDSDSGTNSFLEWTCPADGIYFILVRAYDVTQTGDFRFSVQLQGVAGGEGDPCTDGAILTENSGVISFMPDGNYKDDSLCEWTLACENTHDLVTVVFSRLDTEQDYDWVSLYDGSKSFDPLLDEISGQLADQVTDTFTSSGHELLVSFSTDESVSGTGFELSYLCGREGSTHQQAADADTTEVVADAGPVLIDLELPGEQAWFYFDAQVGATYELVTRLHGLPDTVMHLYDSDRERQLAENDDYDLGRDSYLEWTCPTTARYYVMVTAYDPSQTGDFEFEVTTSSVEGGDGDACFTGATLSEPSAVISNYVIDGQYEDDGQCDWTIQCGAGNGPVRLTITRLETELNYDVVYLYDGADTTATMLTPDYGLSGLLQDLSDEQTHYVSTGPTMLMEFTTDESVGGPGFQASYQCGSEDHSATHEQEITDVAIGGVGVSASVASSEQKWFRFHAVAGSTYEISVMPMPNGLDDSVLHLFDTDMQRQIAENDDYGTGRQSFLEWTCPMEGDYFAAVHGFDASQHGAFQFMITDQGGAGVDPCQGTMTLAREAAAISFMDGTYEHDAQCDWQIRCPASADGQSLVSLTFERFDTELDYDFVSVYDGDSSDAQLLALLSGRMDQLGQTSFTSTTSSLLIEFTSDESESAQGFEASYTCGAADLCLFPEVVQCGEHGQCNSGTCLCLDGYTGTHCEIHPDQCLFPLPVDCGHHGTCAAGLCTCTDGYSGSRCQQRPDPCLYPVPLDCGRHGVCGVEGSGVAFCNCDDGYEGEHCEGSIDPPDLPTDGSAVYATIRPGESRRWRMHAEEGGEYRISTQLFGLPDTVMHLYAPDGTTELAENDDASDGRNSEIEWTCPHVGTYFIVVHGYAAEQQGTFTLTSSQALVGERDDPCTNTVTSDARAAVISFMPNAARGDTYADDALCTWSIDCGGDPVSLVFTQLETEQDYDFVNVFDSADADYSFEMAELSGNFADLDQTEFVSTAGVMAIEFTSDESMGAAGFEAEYVCGTGETRENEIAVTHVLTDGTPVTVNVDTPGQQIWFEFSATQGNTYQIGTELLGIADTVMHLYDADAETEIAENDDNGAERSSYLEWTCPADGTYRVLVHGYDISQTGDFRFAVEQRAVRGGAGDPCVNTATLSVNAAVINFLGNPEYEADSFCDWRITCAQGPITLTFDQFDTEVGYDIITLYSCTDQTCGRDGDDKTIIDEVSGRLADLATTVYTVDQPTMLIEFSSDESINGDGFEAAYTCGGQSTGRAAEPIADGVVSHGSITGNGEQAWYSFAAVADTDYGIAVTLGTLQDSVLHLYGPDGQVQLAENDDAGGTPMSYLEWHCPEDGTYYLMVHSYDPDGLGTFDIEVRASEDGDPCVDGAHMSQENADIRYMPVGGSEADALCQWFIQCPDGTGNVALTFTALDTEADYDFVTLFDGVDSNANPLAELSGRLMDQPQVSFVSTGPSLLLEFITDESVGGAGFETSYSCGDADPCLYPSPVHCGQHGECDSGTGQAVCNCLDGYTNGALGRCEVAPDRCTGVQCGAYGSCSNGFCVCDTQLGYTGASCEVPPDLCEFQQGIGVHHVDCGPHGECSRGLCQCSDGFSGASCDVAPDLCSTSGRAAAGLPPFDCGANGRCFSEPEVDPTCICSNGYTGPICNIPPDSCTYPTPIVCGSHGFCAEGACVCTNRYTGDRCETAPAAILLTSGVPTEVSIDAGGEKAHFEFDAEAGVSYELMTELAGLPDTVMTLYDIVPSTTALLENDDTDVGRESYIAWTCPETGRYSVQVRAYDDTQTGGFRILFRELSGNDPCLDIGGVTMSQETNGIISFSDSNYADDSLCEWTIDCGDSVVNIAFSEFETEDKYDMVTLYDGPDSSSAEIHQLTGTLTASDQLGYTSSTNIMLVEFTSDESISGPGFEASYTCGDGAREYVPVTTDGTVATVEIEAAGQQSWFSFQAMMGETYVISAVVQLTGAGPAADTEAVMHLYDTDGVTQLAENDEASLEGFETSANMEWCARIFCPPLSSARVCPPSLLAQSP